MPLQKKPPASPSAERMIRHAFRDLRSVVSAAHSEDFTTTTLESVREAALEVENQLAARQSLQNMRRLMPLFSGLSHYSKAIDVLCNGTDYLSWLWAPIKLVLQIASDYVEAFERILKAYSSIADSLKRFKVLAQAFYSKPDFQDTLAVFYVDILSFHKVAYLFLKRSCWKRLFLSSWGRFQRRFDHILESLQKHGEQVDREANAYNIAEARDMRVGLEAWRLESLDRIAQEEKAGTTTQVQAIVTWLRADDTDQLLILDMASSEGVKHSVPCSWMLKHKMLAAWLRQDPGLQFLWLQGSPGTGKSIIARQLIGFLRSSQRSIDISHFCTYSYDSSTRYEEILKSLLFQIIRKDDDIAAHVYEEYVAAKKPASIPLLEQLLSTVVIDLAEGIGQSQAVHIIIDGLDEIEGNKARRVVQRLDSITKNGLVRGAVCKVLIVSRATPVLEAVLRRQPTLHMSEEKLQTTAAIKLYSRQRLNDESLRLAQLGLRGGDLMDLSDRISMKADGMFLWARLVLDYLVSNMFYSRQEVLSAVDSLPRTLSEFYERLLTQMMAKFDPRSVDRMKIILGWIAFAKRPLRTTEFRSALMYGLDGFPTELVPSFIFDMCKPLIEERRDSSFAFIHVSVKDYLEDPSSMVHIKQENAAVAHGRSIVTCLLSGIDTLQPSFTRSHRLLRVAKGFHSFHPYAHEFWVEHLCDMMACTLFDQDHTLKSLVQELSDRLAMIVNAAEVADVPQHDSQLGALRSFEGLYLSARVAAQEKVPRKGDPDLAQDESLASVTNVEGLRDILTNYQSTVREVVQMQDIDGVTHEELSRFKQEFGSLAFPCRLSWCPHSISGFRSMSLRLQHEQTHTQRLQCRFTGCQYPPFPSTKALRAHEVQCHDTSLGKVTLRKSQINMARTTSANLPRPNSQPENTEQVGPGKYPPQLIQGDEEAAILETADLWTHYYKAAEGSPTREAILKRILFLDTRLRQIRRSRREKQMSSSPGPRVEHLGRGVPPDTFSAPETSESPIIALPKAGGPAERKAVDTDQLFCICNGKVAGPMVKCSSPACEMGWFHWGCVGLKEARPPSSKWYCDVCNFRLHIDAGQLSGQLAGKPTSPWSVFEESEFANLLEKYGPDWNEMAKRMPSKTPTMLKDYFQLTTTSLASGNYLKHMARKADDMDWFATPNFILSYQFGVTAPSAGKISEERHTDTTHLFIVTGFVCVEPQSYAPGSPQPVIPLSKCKDCVAKKQYRALYIAAVHILQYHFHSRHPGESNPDLWKDIGVGQNLAILGQWIQTVRRYNGYSNQVLRPPGVVPVKPCDLPAAEGQCT